VSSLRHANGTEDDDPFTGLQGHLRHMTKLVDLGADPRDRGIGDHDARLRTVRRCGIGPRARRFPLHVAGEHPAVTSHDRPHGAVPGRIDRPDLDLVASDKPLGGIEVVAGPASQVGVRGGNGDRHRQAHAVVGAGRRHACDDDGRDEGLRATAKR